MKEFMNYILLNLQLFANHVNVTTDVREAGQTYPSYNDLSVEMKTFYDMTLIEEAGPNLVHQQFGQKRPIPKNGGKIIEFRKFENLPKATTALTEGVTPDGKRLEATNITAEVAQYGDYITQSDVLELTAIDNTIVEATKLLGKQAGLTLDTIVRNQLQAGTNVMYCPTISGTTETPVTSRASLDATSQLSVKNIQRAVTKLRSNNVPTINGDYVAIINPYVAFDLMRDPEWVEWHKYAKPEEAYAGEIGKVCGVRFVQSTEAKVYRGEDLASDSRTLTINYGAGYTGAITSVAFDGGTVEADALIGKWIEINGVRALVTDNTSSTLTFASTNFGTIADNTVINPAACAAGAVFGTLIFGEGAYGVTEVSGGGLQTIVKQKGSAGTADPLDQRSSVGWKAILTAEILIQNYLVRVESCSAEYSATAAEN